MFTSSNKSQIECKGDYLVVVTYRNKSFEAVVSATSVQRQGFNNTMQVQIRYPGALNDTKVLKVALKVLFCMPDFQTTGLFFIDENIVLVNFNFDSAVSLLTYGLEPYIQTSIAVISPEFFVSILTIPTSKYDSNLSMIKISLIMHAAG